MTTPTLTFFNSKSGVGKTPLVYHLAWMLSEIDYRVLACDLDPQANLTAAFLSEERLAELWDDGENSPGCTVMQCIEPLLKVGDIEPPVPERITDTLSVIPGDPALTGFEATLSEEWPKALGSGNLYRPFRILTAFSSLIRDGAEQMEADIVLVDVGPNLSAINRSALIASDYLVVPLGADLFSLQGLRNLGPALNRWREEWKRRRENWAQPEFALPEGSMQPIGYVVRQHGLLLDRPIRPHDKWVNRMPEEYARQLLGDDKGPYAETPAQDTDNALATAKHYRGLVRMAKEARKPIFRLTPADGAVGSHAAAARDAYQDFKRLAVKIVKKTIESKSRRGQEVT